MEVSEDIEKLRFQSRDEIRDKKCLEDTNSCLHSSDSNTSTVHSSMKMENSDSTSNETLDNFDSGSWNSDTPLLPIDHDYNENNPTEIHNFSGVLETDIKVETNDINVKNEEQNNAQTIVCIDYQTTDEQSKDKGTTLGSDISIAYSIVRDVEIVQSNPVHVFGSGWEFGSVCSINLHGSCDAFRSRTYTLDSHGVEPAMAVHDTLLHRIFKEKIGSIHFDKAVFDESNKLNNNDQKIDISAPVKTKNLRNLLILSTGMTMLHIAVFGLRNLQSSINSKDGLGVYSLATLFGAFLFGSLASPFVVQRYRPKLCLSVSCFGHFVYVVANYFPNFYVIIPASVIHGLSNALLWNALCTYITELGLDEAMLKNKISSNVLSRYFGIFFLALQMSMVIGNLISSIIFSQSDKITKLYEDSDEASGIMYNSTTVAYAFISNSSNSSGTELTGLDSNQALTRGICGSAHCDVNSGSEAKPSVDDLDKLFLLGTYSSCAILSILVIQCFLGKLPNYIPTRLTVWEAVTQAVSVVTMVIDRKFCFIVPLCLYTVISNGFVVADVLKAFITCPLGVRMVGYSMICFGVCGSVSSYIFGKLAKCTGNLSAFIAASILNLSCLALMSRWEDPVSGDQYWLFALIGAWGFADGIWQSQINSLISSKFADRYETAFGCCRVLQGLAGIIVFTLSNMLCMMSKLIFTTATCIISVALYVIMEIKERKSRALYDKTEISVK